MKINGVEVSSATIGRIAGEFSIRHSDACRDASPRGAGRSYHCCCDFFEQVGGHIDVGEASAAREEAKRLHDAGYQQVSRKYFRVARQVGGSWQNEREVPEGVFAEFRRIVKDAFDKNVEKMKCPYCGFESDEKSVYSPGFPCPRCKKGGPK